ncbi:hypothetical protein [Corynebacterium capitovis]|uniref:hypothetical protein n=1 Tax=Corynebacterium capitovis TaxID=131081 RepID=UPI000591741F|nr:hypothetical protein [Corynebacterium capitovis]
MPARGVRLPTCQWCGAELMQPQGRGRRRKYCSDSCKQRAYEHRLSVGGGRSPQQTADAVIMSPERVATLRDQLFQVRCAAEDIATAYEDGADSEEIRHLCDELIVLTKTAEGLG